MGLPAPAYLSNSSRTVAEMKVAMEDQRDFVADLPGGAPRAAVGIIGGSITPPLGSGGGALSVDTEGLAATDDLTNCVLTNVPEGRYLRLYAANAGRVSTVKHAFGGSGQYLLRDSADFVLNATDKWVEFQRVGSDLIEVDRSYGVDFPGLHDFLRIASVPAHNTLCPHQRLRVDYASASTITIAADAVVLSDASGRLKRFTNISETLNVANTGVNGRDVVDNGGAEQASAWYHVFIMGKSDGTVDAFASQVGFPGSGTSIFSRLPSGYTWAGYVSAFYNDPSSNIIRFVQRGDAVTRAVATVLSGGTATVLTAVSLAAAVPISAREVIGTAYLISTSGSGAANWELYGDTSGNALGAQYFYHHETSVGNGDSGNFSMVLAVAQSFAYIRVGGSSAVTIFISGWRF